MNSRQESQSGTTLDVSTTSTSGLKEDKKKLYYLHDLKVPSVTGIPLLIFNTIVKWLGNWTGLNNKMLRDSNMFVLRGKNISFPATYYPIVVNKDDTSSVSSTKVRVLYMYI